MKKWFSHIPLVALVLGTLLISLASLQFKNTLQNQSKAQETREVKPCFEMAYGVNKESLSEALNNKTKLSGWNEGYSWLTTRNVTQPQHSLFNPFVLKKECDRLPELKPFTVTGTIHVDVPSKMPGRTKNVINVKPCNIRADDSFVCDYPGVWIEYKGKDVEYTLENVPADTSGILLYDGIAIDDNKQVRIQDAGGRMESVNCKTRRGNVDGSCLVLSSLPYTHKVDFQIAFLEPTPALNSYEQRCACQNGSCTKECGVYGKNGQACADTNQCREGRDKNKIRFELGLTKKTPYTVNATFRLFYLASDGKYYYANQSIPRRDLQVLSQGESMKDAFTVDANTRTKYRIRVDIEYPGKIATSPVQILECSGSIGSAADNGTESDECENMQAPGYVKYSLEPLDEISMPNSFEQNCSCYPQLSGESGMCSHFCSVYGKGNAPCGQVGQSCRIPERNNVFVDVGIYQKEINGEAYMKGLKAHSILYKKQNDEWVKVDEHVSDELEAAARTQYRYKFTALPMDGAKYKVTVKLENQGNFVAQEIDLYMCSGGFQPGETCENMTLPGSASFFINVNPPKCTNKCVYSEKKENGDEACFVGVCSSSSEECGFDFNCVADPICVEKTEVKCVDAEAFKKTPKIAEKKVFYIVHNPYLEEQGKTIFEFFGIDASFVDKKAEAAAKALNEIPTNYAEYKIIGIQHYNKVYPFLDKQYTAEQFKRDIALCKELRGDPKKTWSEVKSVCEGVSAKVIDYAALFDELGICDKVNRGEIDEVWNAAVSYSGMGETDMVGPNPFHINGLVQIDAKCNKNVATNSLNAEHLIESIHAFGHRAEATMTHVYNGWKYPAKNNWSIFGRTLKEKDGPISGCGSVHYSPNSSRDNPEEYSTSLKKEELSNCKSFLKYPDLSAPAEPVSCVNWGCNGERYYRWWFGHFPSKEGIGPDGKYMNWFKYIVDNTIETKAGGVAQSLSSKDEAEIQTELDNSDINGDGVVNLADLVAFTDEYAADGKVVGNVQSYDFDVNNDHKINVVDLTGVLKNLGNEVAIRNQEYHTHFDGHIQYYTIGKYGNVINVRDEVDKVDPANQAK